MCASAAGEDASRAGSRFYRIPQTSVEREAQRLCAAGAGKAAREPSTRLPTRRRQNPRAKAHATSPSRLLTGATASAVESRAERWASAKLSQQASNAKRVRNTGWARSHLHDERRVSSSTPYDSVLLCRHPSHGGYVPLTVLTHQHPRSSSLPWEQFDSLIGSAPRGGPHVDERDICRYRPGRQQFDCHLPFWLLRGEVLPPPSHDCRAPFQNRSSSHDHVGIRVEVSGEDVGIMCVPGSGIPSHCCLDVPRESSGLVTCVPTGCAAEHGGGQSGRS
jgi:hypothetical protein